MARKKLTDEELAERNRKRAREWYAKNKERVAAYQLEYKARKKAEEPEEFQARQNEYSAAWRARNPEKRRLAWIKHKYRLTEEQAQRILDDRGMCESCGVEPATDIDHDHDTMRFRGQLCHGCNAAAGFLANDPERAAKLSLYLIRVTTEQHAIYGD